MSNTLSVRLNEELVRWIDEQVRVTGRSRSSLVKEALEKSREATSSQAFMALAGTVDGEPDLSQRKGFSGK